MHVRGALLVGFELVEPYRAALLMRHEQTQRDCSKTIGKPLVEHGTVGVVHHHPVVALGTDGNVGEVERSQHVRIQSMTRAMSLEGFRTIRMGRHALACLSTAVGVPRFHREHHPLVVVRAAA
jgi:hypothetical protein